MTPTFAHYRVTLCPLGGLYLLGAALRCVRFYE